MNQTNASIAIEPEERHRFRYINCGSHGILCGEHDADAPMVTLEVFNATPNYFNNVKFEIWCQLLADDNFSTGIKLSPHTLEKKRTTRKCKRDPSPTQNLCPVQDDMELDCQTNENLRKYKFCLKDYWISLCKNDDIKKNLQEKYAAYQRLNGPHILQDLSQRQNEESKRKKGDKLKRKYEEMQKEQIKIPEDDVLKAYLMFTIFEKNGQHPPNLTATLISKSIISLDSIHINTLCTPQVPVIGADTGNGTKVYLLLRDIKFSYKMQIREIDPVTKNNCWFREVEFCDKEPLNNAMAYIVPEFNCPNHGDDNRETIECHIKLTHGRSESNEMIIYYKNQFTVSLIDLPDILTNPIDEISNDSNDASMYEQSYESERAMMIGHDLESSYENDAAPSLSSLSINDNQSDDDDEPPQAIEYVELKMETRDVVKDKENLFKILIELRDSLCTVTTEMNVEQIWNIFLDKNDRYSRRQNRNKNKSTLFHDAIRFDQFYELECILYTMKCVTNLNAIRKLIGSVRNLYGETLLHLACHDNKIDFIPSLLGMQSEAFLVQNKQGDTPLHVAIKELRLQIIEEFIESEILENDSELWTKILHIYNNAGKTVLHCAVENEELLLVKFLLRHCKEQNIDAFDIRVLGTGQSILHLAARPAIPIEMMNLLSEFCLEPDYYVDYAGYDMHGYYNGPTPIASDEEENEDEDEAESK